MDPEHVLIVTSFIIDDALFVIIGLLWCQYFSFGLSCAPFTKLLRPRRVFQSTASSNSDLFGQYCNLGSISTVSGNIALPDQHWKERNELRKLFSTKSNTYISGFLIDSQDGVWRPPQTVFG